MRQGCRESQRSYLGRPVVRLTSNSDSDVRLRRQESAEVTVPGIFFREGLNIERTSKLSSSRDEHRRPNFSDRETAVQTKQVKPMGVVQRVEFSPARDRRKSRQEIAILGEPPDAVPHVRWCERERLAAALYSIGESWRQGATGASRCVTSVNKPYKFRACHTSLNKGALKVC